MQASGMTSQGAQVSTQSQPNATNYLKATQKVGSVRNGQMNYSRDQTCFNRWDDPAQDGTKIA